MKTKQKYTCQDTLNKIKLKEETVLKFNKKNENNKQKNCAQKKKYMEKPNFNLLIYKNQHSKPKNKAQK